MEAYEYKKLFEGKPYILCKQCNAVLNVIESDNSVEGKQYLQSKIDDGLVQPLGMELIKEYLGEEAKVAMSSTTEKKENNDSPKYNVKNTPVYMVMIGIVFLIIAGIMYYLSVNNEYGIANMQGTVFAAAAFVAAIVNFVGYGVAWCLVQSKRDN